MKCDIWNDCPKAPLTDLLTFIVDNRGKTVPTATQGHKLIATNCVTNNTLYPVYEKIRYLSDETYSDWFRAHPLPGDILFVNKGTPGRVCMVPNPVDFCIAQDMIALRADDSKIYNKYLFAILRSHEIQQQIYNTSVGDVIPHFKKQFLNQLLIPIPSRSIQEAIGNLYFKFCLKAELNKKINDNLERQAQNIFKSWFVDFEPFGGSKPDDWAYVTLSEISKISTTVFSPQKNPNVLVEHYSIPAYDESHYPVFEMSDGIKSNKYKITNNSVIISKLNPETKRIWRPYCLSDNSICSTEFIVYEPLSSEYRDFVYSVIDSDGFSKFLCSHTTGSTNSRQRATPSVTLNYKAVLPDSETLKKFCAAVSPMYDMVEKNILESQKLAKIRDSLLPRLMSGELDVSKIEL